MSDNLGMMEIGELILVVIMVMILLVAGLVAFSFFSQESMQERSREFASLDAVALAQEVLAMPEIACKQQRCFDQYRLNYFNTTEVDWAFYTSRLGQSLVQVHEVYPGNRTWTVWNNSIENKSATPIRTPVLIHNSIEGTESFGYLEVIRYG